MAYIIPRLPDDNLSEFCFLKACSFQRLFENFAPSYAMATRRSRGSIELENQTRVSLSDLSNGEARQAPSETGSNASLRGPGESMEQQLEPADGGAAAWKILFATFMFEAVLFGEFDVNALRGQVIDFVDQRLLCFIWCLSGSLHTAPRVQG